jgi:aminoglycoside phosphotransferase (APT) family kinase protein
MASDSRPHSTAVPLATGLPEAISPRWQKAFDWVGAAVGGRVVAAERQPRWRPAWYLDVERDGQLLPIYFRGDRNAAGGGSSEGRYALEHEYEVLRILGRNGIPVPAVYGFCPEPRGIVMERAAGLANQGVARDDDDWRAIMDDYIEVLARIHAIDLGEFESLGIAAPSDARALGLADFPIWVKGFRKQSRRPEPAIEFLVRWVERNVPRGRDRPVFVCADSGQFMFDERRVTAVIDLELSTLGDPMADLGGMLGRDLSEPLGDLGRAIAYYEKVAGTPLDYDAIDFHAVRFCTVTPLAVAPIVANPMPGADFAQYLSWYLVYTRAPLEILARRLGVEVGDLALPEATPTRHTPGHRALAQALQPGQTDDFAAYEQDAQYRVAEYLRRADELGPAIEQLDLDDAAELLGHRPSDWRAADLALAELARDAAPERDAELVRVFLRRTLRQESILQPVMREFEGCRVQQITR